MPQLVTPPMQRLRIRYCLTREAAEVRPGDLGKLWANAFAAAGIALARPEGAKRARIELGPALPQGATGEREPVDVWIDSRVEPCEVSQRLGGHLPAGIVPVAVEEIGDRLPSLGASLRSASYRVALPASIDLAALRERVLALLALEALRWVEVRGERVREVDLRAQVLDLAVSEDEAGPGLEMRLVLEQERAGRPTSVLAALDIEGVPSSLVRTDVEVAQPLVALRAWRAVGRFR